MTRTLPYALLACLLATSLAGCIAYQDEAPDDGWNQVDHPDAIATEDCDAAPPVYADSWTGLARPEATVAIACPLDFVIATFAHTGQLLGNAVYTSADGQAHDEGLVRATSGTYALTRTLPGTAGDAHFAVNGLSSGTSAFALLGQDDMPPSLLLSATWSGQRLDTIVLENTMQFYVPPGVTSMMLSLAGSGQNAPGMRITDPDGNERASLTAAGTATTTETVEGSPGLWTVHLSGMAGGAFTATAVALSS